MALAIKEDIPIVPILDLQKVGDDRVAWVGAIVSRETKYASIIGPASEFTKFRWARAKRTDDGLP